VASTKSVVCTGTCGSRAMRSDHQHLHRERRVGDRGIDAALGEGDRHLVLTHVSSAFRTVLDGGFPKLRGPQTRPVASAPTPRVPGQGGDEAKLPSRRPWAAAGRPLACRAPERPASEPSHELRQSRAAAATVFLATGLVAQSFTYANFASISQLSLLGNAAQSGTALRLTANSSNQTGWVWRQGALPVAAGFDTTFTFRVTPPTVGTKAEGMALVIHDDPNGTATVGGTVWGMGYGVGANSAVGIRNSIAIEFDTYQDGFLSDTSANELTIHTRGAQGNNENEQYSIARATPAQNLANGQVHTLRVRYVPGTIEVFVDGATTPLISRAYSLVTGGLYANGTAAPGANMTNGTAIAGFCATTGAGTLTELVEILSWTWNSTPLTPPCYAGSLPQDVLRIDGSTGGPLRKV